jgi:hypothetical protein
MSVAKLLIPALLLHFSLAALQAQVPEPACTYRECALRIEPRWLGTAVVQGAEGQIVARVGMAGTRPALGTLVVRSDSAVVHARRFERLAPRAAAATLAGSLLFVVPALADQDDPAVVLGASVGGAALTLYGTVALLRAQRALSRSIWWYNESLVP